MKKLISTLILIIFLYACNSIDTHKSKFTIILPDTAIFHHSDFYYEMKKIAEEELLLNKLENGSDTLELRLWAKVEVLMGGQVFVIKKIKGKWTCLHYTYFYKREVDYENGMDYFKWYSNIAIDTFWVKKLQPNSNWKTFFYEIEKENIYNLPSQSDIKGWSNIVNDGYTFSIEYATKDKYKFYSYNCPDVYENKFKECRQMSNILRIFNKEFGLKMGIYENEKYRCSTK